MNEFMKEALIEAEKGISNGDGGPFGAVIVKDGKIIGRGHNCVLKNNDPTAHGEIMAIRDACKNLQTFDLGGAILYTTCYPCPMCLGAMMWARISKSYYGCDSIDANAIGFDDENFYGKICSTDFVNSFLALDDADSVANCKKLFQKYTQLDAKRY